MKYTMWQQSKDLVRLFKRELRIYQSVLADSRTPIQAKIFLGLAVGYLCMPFDLIPDFIPVIGHLDDVRFHCGRHPSDGSLQDAIRWPDCTVATGPFFPWKRSRTWREAGPRLTDH